MNAAIYAAHLLVTGTMFGALYLAPRCSLGYRPLLSGYTIVIFPMILYVAFSACFSIYFNDMESFLYPQYSTPATILGTLMVCWISTLMFVGFYHFFARRDPVLVKPEKVVRPLSVYFAPLAYGLVAIGMLMKVLYVYRQGGLHMVMVSRSNGIAQSLGLETSTDYITSNLTAVSFLADAAACWLFLTALRARKQVAGHLILVGIVLIGTFIVSIKRDVLIAPLMALIVGISIYWRPLEMRRAPLFLVAALLFSVLTLFGRILLPAYLAHIDLFGNAGSSAFRTFVIHLMATDTGYFDGNLIAIYGAQDIIAKFGGWWDAFARPNLIPLIYLIPRFVWPSKPDDFIDLGAALYAIQSGVPLTMVRGGAGLCLTGSAWIYGGLFGLTCAMALLGWAAHFVDRFLAQMHRASPSRILIFAVSAMVLFHLYRQGTIGFTFLTFVQVGALFWLAAVVLAYTTLMWQRRRDPAIPTLPPAGE
jgi:hypothetical protein